MKIALIGYGKMGHAIEQIALHRGHDIILRISSANINQMTAQNLQQADIAIEFTSPEVAKENVLKCIESGIGVVSGSTGWNDALPTVTAKVIEKQVAFIHASNFSIGVNLFFEVNKFLASLMYGQQDYHVSINETHHTQKKDAPSGTAITLAQQVIDHLKTITEWQLNEAANKQTLPIFAHRTDNIVGTHLVKYSSVTDDIEIIHTAHNRDGFALGAVIAAEFILGKKGVFTMMDVIGIK